VRKGFLRVFSGPVHALRQFRAIADPLEEPAPSYRMPRMKPPQLAAGQQTPAPPDRSPLGSGHPGPSDLPSERDAGAHVLQQKNRRIHRNIDVSWPPRRGIGQPPLITAVDPAGPHTARRAARRQARGPGLDMHRLPAVEDPLDGPSTANVHIFVGGRILTSGRHDPLHKSSGAPRETYG
jgi:hypothetical protein